MFLIIDNYDSFTYNLYQYMCQITAKKVEVRRNDEITVEGIKELSPEGIIISPGPGRPEESGIIIDCIKEFAGKIPILGVCLGHQAIGAAFGGDIILSSKIYHGKTDKITNDGKGVFRNLSPVLDMVRYHSLVIDSGKLPAELEITATSSDGEIMGVRHRQYDVEGVQFHPESYGSESGIQLLKNFINYRRESCTPKKILTTIMKHKNLIFEEASDFMEELTEGNLSEAVIAGFLTALNTKGISAEEIAGCASVLKRKKKSIRIEGKVIDTCGTGGDELGTFNISSLAAIAAASCGAKVAKHGNRAVSSLTGSADFYRELGVPVDITPKEAEKMIDKEGFAFLFAPFYHSAMRFAGPVRQKLGFKTIMNLLGPLVNPADTKYQLIGVYDPSLCRTMAEAAKILGAQRVMIVHGLDGQDEISVTGGTRIVTIDEKGNEDIFTFDPLQNGLKIYDISELKGGNASVNAAIALEVVNNRGYEAVKESVSLNGGAALYVSGIAGSIMEGYGIVKESIESGRVRAKLDTLTGMNRMLPAKGNNK